MQSGREYLVALVDRRGRKLDLIAACLVPGTAAQMPPMFRCALVASLLLSVPASADTLHLIDTQLQPPPDPPAAFDRLSGEFFGSLGVDTALSLATVATGFAVGAIVIASGDGGPLFASGTGSLITVGATFGLAMLVGPLLSSLTVWIIARDGGRHPSFEYVAMVSYLTRFAICLAGALVGTLIGSVTSLSAASGAGIGFAWAFLAAAPIGGAIAEVAAANADVPKPQPDITAQQHVLVPFGMRVVSVAF